jgi:hypothetical protein
MRNGPTTQDTMAKARGGPQAQSAEPQPEVIAAEELELQRELTLAFAPIHKRAFGVALGATCALVMVVLTLFHMLLDHDREINISLLSQYFYGYSLSWAGVFIGAFWGFVVGFVGGWFAAFCRNLAVAISVFVTRTRAELRETREFLDHI